MAKIWPSGWLLLSILLTGVGPNSAYAAEACFQVFMRDAAYVQGFKRPEPLTAEHEAFLRERLERKCRSGAALRMCKDSEYDYVEYYEGKELLGQVRFKITEGTDTLMVHGIYVRPEARGGGISTLLLQKMVEVSGPGLREVMAQMADSNYKAILDEYYDISYPGSPRFIPGLSQKAANVLAAQAAPFVKSMLKLGFIKIEEAHFIWDMKPENPYVADIVIVLAK